MKPDQFKRQVLGFFFVASATPVLLVLSVRYFLDQAPIWPYLAIGILPAILLSLIFAQLLSHPVRRILDTVQQLAKGNLQTQFSHQGTREFEEIGLALDQVATRLQQTISQAASEQSIIEAERNKLRGVLNAMTDGVFALDRSGRIILFNKAASELTGRTIEEVAGQLSEKVMPFRQNGELVMTRFLASRTGNENKVGEWKGLELYRADGASLVVDVQAKMLTEDPNGIATLITFHDLTKSHQLEQMKVDFVALAAHELRTPLTEIKGYLDILHHEAKHLSKTNRDFLERSIDSANHLGGLMHNLLNVSRIEHGELGHKPEKIDYRVFLVDVINEFSERAKQQKRTLKLEVPMRLPALYADPLGLREVLGNLIENAINHTAPGLGTITVSVEHHPHELETSVKDNGVGIPANAMPHLFQKFYRVDEMRSTTSGTGLGLFISKAIVDVHGGHIWAESVEGEGSTFSFRLPLKAATVASADAPEDNNSKPPVTQTITPRGAHGWIKDHPIH
ncbi:MAG: multi-sensor signal transduction histidine kinase [Candidatus Saccharibacteria bacterium]|nr:multi-sensor signal transduction histidine kinase [Candidatus Saccharibacteria bacterium]